MTVTLKLVQGQEMMARLSAASRTFGSAKEAALAAMAEDARRAIKRRLEGESLASVISNELKRKLPDPVSNNDKDVAASLRVKKASADEYGVTAVINDEIGEPKSLRVAVAEGTRFITVRAAQTLLKPLRG